MFKNFLLCFSLIFSSVSFSLIGDEAQFPCDDSSEISVETLDVDLISRAVGHMLAKQLKNPGFEFNLDKMIEGMKEEVAGLPSPMKDVEIQQALAAIQEKVFLQLAETNLAAANEFLKENATKENVVTIDEKLQYTITKVGSGNKVEENSTPLVHYTGRMIDGTVFSSSRDQENPISLPLAQSIPGFSKGMMNMCEGEERTIFIHPDLAYGISGGLPPNALLIFDIAVIKANSEEEIAKEENITE